MRSERVASEPASLGHAERYDYQYTQQGVCNLFLASEPLAGRRYVSVTKQHTAQDWALFMRYLIEVQYTDAETIVLVMDSLTPHTPASFYNVFPPEEARRLTEKLEIHSTPTHGSRLNMAKIELSVLARHCLSRPVDPQEVLTHQIATWQA